MSNPIFFSYNSEANVVALAEPTAIFVTGQGNRNEPEFQEARAKGAEVYPYFNFLNLPSNISHPLNMELYGEGKAASYLWGNNRSNWPGTKLLDIRVGSPWVDWCTSYLGNIIASDKFDGVFLDTLGARLWNPLLAWDTIPKAEQLEFTNGAVELARRLDTIRRQLNPTFKIMHNNLWQLDPRGEAYCDGVCLENVPLSDFHKAYAGRAFGNLGQRRVAIVAKSNLDAAVWAGLPGVTHVCNQHDYSVVPAPIVGYTDLRIPELKTQILVLKDQLTQRNTEVRNLKDQVYVLENESDRMADALDTAVSKLNKIGVILNG